MQWQLMSPQLCSGRRWHCDVRSIPPLRLMRGDSGFGQDRCDMHSENRKHSLKRKEKKKRSTTDIFLFAVRLKTNQIYRRSTNQRSQTRKEGESYWCGEEI